MESSANVNTEKFSGTRRCDEVIHLLDQALEIEPIIIDHHQERLDALREFSGLCWYKVGEGEISASECEQNILWFQNWVEHGESGAV